MSESAQVSDESLRVAWAQLSELARSEYGEGLDELLVHDDPVRSGEYDLDTMALRDSHDAFWRIGRLMGITIKEPFATPQARTDQESQTDALRVWNLDPRILDVERPDLWQYNLISDFLTKVERVRTFDWLPPQQMTQHEQVADFLIATHAERGLFRALVHGLRPHLCDDPDVREQLAKEISKGRIEAEPAQMFASGVTASAASLIIAVVPWLGPEALPVVAGITLIVAAKGIDAFCSRTLPAPTHDLVET